MKYAFGSFVIGYFLVFGAVFGSISAVGLHNRVVDIRQYIVAQYK